MAIIPSVKFRRHLLGLVLYIYVRCSQFHVVKLVLLRSLEMASGNSLLPTMPSHLLWKYEGTGQKHY